ncbi:MAG: tetratricopeptide repeat protein [Candidatus Hodarchaeota archaeon]
MQNATTDSVKSLVHRAEHFHRFGELSAAEEALRNALKEDKSYGPAWDLLGLVYLDAEKLKKAEECFEKAIATDKKWLDPVENLGMLQYSQGEYKEAIQTLTRYIDLGGSDIDVLLGLTKAAFQVNDCKTVLSVTSKILEIEDDLYEVWEMRGICQATLDRFNAACTSLNAAIDLNPRAINAINTVGNLCYKAENYVRAVEFYEMSLKVRKKQPTVLFRYGTSLWLIERWPEAIPVLEQYTELSPEDPKGWNNLGVVLREKGEVKRAVECYKKALDIDKTLEIVERNLETAKDMQVLL